jgi:hypothetical protein
MTKTVLFGISNFVYWDLFGGWCLALHHARYRAWDLVLSRNAK